MASRHTFFKTLWYDKWAKPFLKSHEHSWSQTFTAPRQGWTLRRRGVKSSCQPLWLKPSSDFRSKHHESIGMWGKGQTENVGVEGETTKLWCAAFLSCDPKTGASISCARVSTQLEVSRRITVAGTHESQVICNAASLNRDSRLWGVN